MRTLAKIIMLGALLSGFGLAAGSAQTETDDAKIDLKVGDKAPAFQASDDEGRPWKSADHVGKKFIVIYFYPGDFTPGCIKQAEGFRDNMNSLKFQGVEVVGVSGDSVKTHAAFKLAHMLYFTLLADEEGSLAKRFGVPVRSGAEFKAKDIDGKSIQVKRGVTAARWTFIIALDGTIIYKNTKVNPIEDSKQVAAVIEKSGKK